MCSTFVAGAGEGGSVEKSRARPSISSIDTSNSLKAVGALTPSGRIAPGSTPSRGAGAGAADFPASASTSSRTSLKSQRSSTAGASCGFLASGAGVPSRRRRSMFSSNSLDSKGLNRTPLAPLALKRASSRGTRVPARMRTGIFSVFSMARSSAATAKPFFPGRVRSATTRSGRISLARRTASSPLSTEVTAMSERDKASSNTFRMVRLSSARRSFFGMVTPDCPSY